MCDAQSLTNKSKCVFYQIIQLHWEKISFFKTRNRNMIKVKNIKFCYRNLGDNYFSFSENKILVNKLTCKLHILLSLKFLDSYAYLKAYG